MDMLLDVIFFQSGTRLYRFAGEIVFITLRETTLWYNIKQFVQSMQMFKGYI